MTISDAKELDQFFSSEVLPVLKKNLSSCSLKSEQRVYAVAYGNNSTQPIPAEDVHYIFEVEGKKIQGRAMIFTRNCSFDKAG